MDILQEFIKLEIEEGKKLPAALALSTALLAPAAFDNAHKKQEKQLAQMSNAPAQKKEELKKSDAEKQQVKQPEKEGTIMGYEVSSYSRSEMKEFVTLAAEEYGISPAFLDGIISQESRYNQHARSHKNAMGVAQFIQATADDMGLKNPYNAKEAIYASAKYLKTLLDINDGDYVLAAASYNAGPRNVKKYGGVPPFPETQDYVKKVIMRAENSQFYEGEDLTRTSSITDTSTKTSTKT